MAEITKCICQNCGAVNEVTLPEGGEDKEWLGCILPSGFEWKLPAGKITPVVGDPIYVSASGEHLSWARYIEKYGIDPEIAYTRMRLQSGHEKREALIRGQPKKQS